MFSAKKRIWVVVVACATILNVVAMSMVPSNQPRWQSVVDRSPFYSGARVHVTFQHTNKFIALHDVVLPIDNGLLFEKDRHRRRKPRQRRDYDGLDIVFPKRRVIQHRVISHHIAFAAQSLWDEKYGELGTNLVRQLNCNTFQNTFHELGLTTTSIDRRYRAKKLGQGRYREAFELQLHAIITETVVWKKHLQDRRYAVNSLYINMVRREAEVMSAVSASPNTIDIYGYCQVDVLVEAAGDKGVASSLAFRGRWKRRRQIKRKKGNVENAWRLNDLTLLETVHYSLQAALGVRDLHASGFVHDDMKISQFIAMPDNRLKLNDFNLARQLVMDSSNNTAVPVSNHSATMKEQCRAPEICHGWSRDETFDVFVLGGIFYNFLTGQEVPRFWQANQSYTPEQYPLTEIRNSLHPAEQKFVKIMYGCWAIDRHDRSSAAYLVKRLDRLMTHLTCDSKDIANNECASRNVTTIT